MLQCACYTKTISNKRKPPKPKGERKCRNTFT
nr:MAG TPA: hypothetical protein [Caudoviricetes sp.]